MPLACQSSNRPFMYFIESSRAFDEDRGIADRLLLLVDRADLLVHHLRADLHVADGMVAEGLHVALPDLDALRHQLAHRRLEVVVADHAAGDAGSAGGDRRSCRGRRCPRPSRGPLASSICARWKAVLRPWMPAPITAYFALCGMSMSRPPSPRTPNPTSTAEPGGDRVQIAVALDALSGHSCRPIANQFHPIGPSRGSSRSERRQRGRSRGGRRMAEAGGARQAGPWRRRDHRASQARHRDRRLRRRRSAAAGAAARREFPGGAQHRAPGARPARERPGWSRAGSAAAPSSQPPAQPSRTSARSAT